MESRLKLLGRTGSAGALADAEGVVASTLPPLGFWSVGGFWLGAGPGFGFGVCGVVCARAMPAQIRKRDNIRNIRMILLRTSTAGGKPKWPARKRTSI